MSRFLSLSLAKMPYLCSPLGKSSRFEVRGSRLKSSRVREFESSRVGELEVGELEVGGWRLESWRLEKEEESIRFRMRRKIRFGNS